MSTSARVGKLYAYFLDISKRIISCIVHQDMGVPEEGDKLYDFLARSLANGSEEGYNYFIWNDIPLTRVQRNLLAPENRIINVKKLDFSIYLKIIELLRENIKRREIRYLINTRNNLCHFGLGECMGKKDFKDQLDFMTIHFEDFNFPKCFLESRLNLILNSSIIDDNF